MEHENKYRIEGDLQVETDIIASITLSLIVWLVGWFMVFNATFNNISVKSWQSVLLVEETGVPREHYRPVASH